MGRSNIRTLLSLDEYARIMSIPGWVFNQVTHPIRQAPGCQGVMYQSGYSVSEVYYTGRDEVAQAIATAERQIAAVLGFWPAPKYTCGETVEWPVPLRGVGSELPWLKTRWGHLDVFGIEAFESVQLGAAVVYSDDDGDGVDDLATITVASLYGTDVTSKCEVVVVFAGMSVENGQWEIRPLDVSIANDGTITVTGPRWLFVDPDEWKTETEILLSDDAKFVTTVDVYRRYTDPTTQGTLTWDIVCGTDTVCSTESVSGCCQVKNKRVGMFNMQPATYDEDTLVWTRSLWTYGYPPNRVQVSYLSGYTDDTCEDCSQMGASLKEAIARLATVHLAESPCCCSVFETKYSRDRTILDVTTRAIARAQSLFGTAAAGAVFALSVLDRLDSIGKGG